MITVHAQFLHSLISIWGSLGKFGVEDKFIVQVHKALDICHASAILHGSRR